ncbi:hypothetical protein AHAS_Ahas18G0100300 [Arachis hypogaea]
MIGRNWKNTRKNLFHKFYDSRRTFEQNANYKPLGMDANHWKWFLEYRLKHSTKITNIQLEAIEHIEGQDASSKELSQNDSLAQSDSGVQIEEYQKDIAELKAEAAGLKAEAAKEKAKRQIMTNLLRYLIQQQGDICHLM